MSQSILDALFEGIDIGEQIADCVLSFEIKIVYLSVNYHFQKGFSIEFHFKLKVGVYSGEIDQNPTLW
jgi:hypothetical protein